jgi:putative sigma-54 modulation protein
MKVKIQGSSNFTVSQRIKDYIDKRVDKLNYFQSHIDDLNIHIESEKLQFRLSAILSIKKIGVYKFEATADEVYTAIDKLVHKMDVKINREKSKIQKHNNMGHEQMIEFFFHHDKNDPEPTRNIPIKNKPATLIDAYLEMKLENQDFLGFNLIEEDSDVAPAFLRRLDDDIVYLFKKNGNGSYSEVSLKTTQDKVEESQKIREIVLEKMSLMDAQKNILDQDYHFNLFLDHQDRVSFLFKEGNGKWKLIS